MSRALPSLWLTPPVAVTNPDLPGSSTGLPNVRFQAVAEAYGITAMPTFQVFVQGTKVEDFVGASSDKLKALIAKYASSPDAGK